MIKVECAYPLRKVVLRIKVGAPVTVGVVVAQFGLQRQSGQTEETFLSGRLSVSQDIFSQLKVVMLPRHTIPVSFKHAEPRRKEKEMHQHIPPAQAIFFHFLARRTDEGVAATYLMSRWLST